MKDKISVKTRIACPIDNVEPLNSAVQNLRKFEENRTTSLCAVIQSLPTGDNSPSTEVLVELEAMLSSKGYEVTVHEAILILKHQIARGDPTFIPLLASQLPFYGDRTIGSAMLLPDAYHMETEDDADIRWNVWYRDGRRIHDPIGNDWLTGYPDLEGNELVTGLKSDVTGNVSLNIFSDFRSKFVELNQRVTKQYEDKAWFRRLDSRSQFDFDTDRRIRNFIPEDETPSLMHLVKIQQRLRDMEIDTQVAGVHKIAGLAIEETGSRQKNDVIVDPLMFIPIETIVDLVSLAFTQNYEDKPEPYAEAPRGQTNTVPFNWHFPLMSYDVAHRADNTLSSTFYYPIKWLVYHVSMRSEKLVQARESGIWLTLDHYRSKMTQEAVWSRETKTDALRPYRVKRVTDLHPKVNLEPSDDTPRVHLEEALGVLSSPIGIASKEAHAMYATCNVHLVHVVHHKKKASGENNRDTRLWIPLFYGPARATVQLVHTGAELWRSQRIDWPFLNNVRYDFDVQSACRRIGSIGLDGNTILDYNHFADSLLEFDMFERKYYTPNYNTTVERICQKYGEVVFGINGMLDSLLRDRGDLFELVARDSKIAPVSMHEHRRYAELFHLDEYQLDTQTVHALTDRVMRNYRLHATERDVIEDCFRTFFIRSPSNRDKLIRNPEKLNILEQLTQHVRSLDLKIYVCAEVSRKEVKKAQLPLLRGDIFRAEVQN